MNLMFAIGIIFYDDKIQSFNIQEVNKRSLYRLGLKKAFTSIAWSDFKEHFIAGWQSDKRKFTARTGMTGGGGGEGRSPALTKQIYFQLKAVIITREPNESLPPLLSCLHCQQLVFFLQARIMLLCKKKREKRFLKMSISSIKLQEYYKEDDAKY